MQGEIPSCGISCKHGGSANKDKVQQMNIKARPKCGIGRNNNDLCRKKKEKGEKERKRKRRKKLDENLHIARQFLCADGMSVLDENCQKNILSGEIIK